MLYPNSIVNPFTSPHYRLQLPADTGFLPQVSMSGNEIEGMDDEQLKAKYEAQLQEQVGFGFWKR